MDRIIEVKVFGNHLTKDNKNAGTRGEANSTRLRITFDEGWDGYAKEVVFWDAYGANPVRIILTENLMESIRVYLVPIPAEAMARAGMLTFTIRGVADDKIQESITGKLEVKDSQDILEPIPPTPTELQEMQKQVEDVLDKIVDAAEATKAIENMGVSSETLSPGTEAFVRKNKEDGSFNLHFGVPAGDKGDKGDEGVGVKSIVQEGEHFLFTMTDGRICKVSSPDCTEIVQSAASASESAANALASKESAAASAANANGSAKSAAASATAAEKSEGEANTAAKTAKTAAREAAERAAEEAAEEAAQSVYEKLKFVDETGTVDLGDYARKEYVDKGDTALKEVYDEPKETNVPYTQRDRYFTINSDTWDTSNNSTDYFAEGAGIAGGIVNVTAKQDGTFKMECDIPSAFSLANEIATILLYYKVNGETVHEKNIQLARGESAKESFTMQLKTGDVVEAGFAADGYCEIRLICHLVEAVKLHTPKVLATEAIANKLFRLEGSETVKTLEPPTGHEMFFYDHPLYEGFSCYADVPDFIMFLMFEVPNYPNTQPHHITADNFALEGYDSYFAGGVCLLTYLGNYEWSAIALDAGLARKDLKNLPTSVFKAKMIEAMPELDDVSSMMEALPDMEAVSSISKYISAYVFSNLGEDQTIFVAKATHSLGDILQIIPSSVDLSGAYPAYVHNAEKSTQIKIYSSDGSLTDPTFVAGKPVRLVHNGMYYIVTV